MELIVVDDASDDGETEEWCCEQEHLQEKPEQPFRYIRIPKEESKGGNHARNVGILAAHGEYIAFLDDDDAWLPQKTEKQMALLKEKSSELVYGGMRLEFVQGDEISYVDVAPYLEGDLTKKILLTICATTTTTIFAKKQALIDIGLFDEALRFWQDYELTIRMAQRTPFYFIKEPVALYRIDRSDQNRLTNKLSGWRQSVKYIHKKHADLFSRLSFRERILVRHLYWQDAASRAISSGKRFHAESYRILEIVSRKIYYSLSILKDEGLTRFLIIVVQRILGIRKSKDSE